MAAEVIGKSLELLKETVPNLSCVAVLWKPSNVIFQGQILGATEDAAPKLTLELQSFGVRGPDEFDVAFASITNGARVRCWCCRIRCSHFTKHGS